MNTQLPWDITADDDDGEKAAPAAGARTGQRLIAMMLLTAAALDLTRCGLVLAPARHLVPAAGLAAAGLAAAALTVRTARGCQAGQRWAGWAALLIGAMSLPQAAASGFHGPYTIPDTATAALGILLTVTVLATAGPAGPPRRDTENPCAMDRRTTGDPASHEGRSATGDPARGEGRSARISDLGSHGQTSLWRPARALYLPGHQVAGLSGAGAAARRASRAHRDRPAPKAGAGRWRQPALSRPARSGR